MKATVTAKGQITIPHRIRKRLNFHAGSILEFDETAHYLIARRAVDPKTIHKMRSAIGCAKGSRSAATDIVWAEVSPLFGSSAELRGDFLVAAHALHQADGLIAADRGYTRRYFQSLVLHTL